MPLDEEVRDIVRMHGATKQIPLPAVAAKTTQDLELFDGLDPFRRDPDAKIAAERD